ncbi:MAG: hypothetical protein ACE5DI_00110 [Candidatus Micrarchaeia archaeon]
MRESKRGQVFTGDFVLSVFVFLIIVTVAGVFWNNLNDSITASENRKDLEFATLVASESLIRTSGNPFNWSNDNLSAVKSIGLAVNAQNQSADSHIINASKAVMLVRLMEDNYSFAKNVLGLGAFEFGFSITNKSGQVVNASCEVGCWCGSPCWKSLNYSTFDSVQADDAAVIRRIAIIDVAIEGDFRTRKVVNVNVFGWKEP